MVTNLAPLAIDEGVAPTTAAWLVSIYASMGFVSKLGFAAVADRINLRYGCTILRHYLDIEKGDLYRALGRYNGSLGRPEYPNMVRAAWEKQWAWAAQTPGSR